MAIPTLNGRTKKMIMLLPSAGVKCAESTGVNLKIAEKQERSSRDPLRTKTIQILNGRAQFLFINLQ